jgi:phospholipid/cholesterol/gamma-HCH transport system ATP-binding protein
MITHDLDTLLATCNRVAVLIDRKIVVDTLDGIMKNPHPWIQEYFHGPRARAAVASARPAGGQ